MGQRWAFGFPAASDAAAAPRCTHRALRPCTFHIDAPICTRDNFSVIERGARTTDSGQRGARQFPSCSRGRDSWSRNSCSLNIPLQQIPFRTHTTPCAAPTQCFVVTLCECFGCSATSLARGDHYFRLVSTVNIDKTSITPCNYVIRISFDA